VPQDDRSALPSTTTTATTSPPLYVALAWLVVSLPLLWGVLQTLKKSAALFH
jgi:hypothetical protein